NSASSALYVVDQKRFDRAEGFAPMADGGLCIARFGERFSIRRVEEDRVVAEPAVALRRRRDGTLHDTARLEQNTVALYNGDGTDEPGPARLESLRAKRGVDQGKLFRVRGFGAAKARRLDARRSAEGVDFE